LWLSILVAVINHLRETLIRAVVGLLDVSGKVLGLFRPALRDGIQASIVIRIPTSRDGWTKTGRQFAVLAVVIHALAAIAFTGAGCVRAIALCQISFLISTFFSHGF